jgi:release factor glutamine methyltransferase
MQESSETRVATMLRAACARIDAVDAEWLLAHTLEKPRGWLYAHADDSVDASVRQRFEALVERRAAGEPVAYLTGTRGFWSIDLYVTTDTLIPRAETELLVELALARLPADKDCDVADLGTGSGAIALAIASERPRARVVAIDASTAALDVARRNATDLGIRTVEFRQGDGARRWGMPCSILSPAIHRTWLRMTRIGGKATCVMNPKRRWCPATMGSTRSAASSAE